MPTPLAKAQLFPEQLVPELVNMVRGKSAVAALCAATPIPFNGLKEFTFSMDSEIALVAESGNKPAGTLSLTPRTIAPVKVVYQARVTDEFMYGADELRINLLKNFSEGYSRKLAKGLDLMAFHGVNPATGNISSLLANNYFDVCANQTVTYNAANNASTPDSCIEDAIGLIQANYYDPTGVALSSSFRTSLAQMTLTTGERVYPQLAWGAAQNSMNGVQTVINTTVSAYPTTANNVTTTVHAIVGDWHSAFRWGYSLQPTLEIIEYGDPDGSGVDLKQANQVELRSETYLGFAILDNSAFSRVIVNAAAG